MIRGVDPAIWGPSGWMLLHGISFMKDKHPTKAWFLNMRYVLPCCTCQDNFRKHTEALGDMHADLRKWVYKLHARVNKMKGKPTPAFSEVVAYWKGRTLTWSDILPLLDAIVNAHAGKGVADGEKYKIFWDGLFEYMGATGMVELTVDIAGSRGELRQWWKRNKKRLGL